MKITISLSLTSGVHVFAFLFFFSTFHTACYSFYFFFFFFLQFFPFFSSDYPTSISTCLLKALAVIVGKKDTSLVNALRPHQVLMHASVVERKAT